MVSRIDAFQRRHPAAGFPLAVVYKFLDDRGGYLSALIAYYAFLSLFPLLLLFTTLLGIVLSGNPELQERILDSAMSQIPVIGDQLGQPDRLSGGVTAIVIGVVGSLYGGLGVSLAAQHALNTAWSVPRNIQPDPLRARLRGLLLLTTVGSAIVGLTVLNAVASSGMFGVAGGTLALVGAIVLNSAVFAAAFRIGTARALSVRDVLPGAIAAAVIWQALQSFGGIYIRYVVGNVSTSNGVFAIVLGLLGFLYVASVLIVVCIEINAVRVDNLHPRALLTPFTDNVDLTEGDKNSYTGQAEAQRNKGFQEITVTYDDSDAR
ncbi:YihY/virulence factor BrkB family protein [Rhodococcus sp. BP-252]|uniref:YihY/virulence factor BrkB family protein n=1 Tax=unclassified Rhodococcus (in: high G+C Gram-positive bacteria) TaxID=192944 RepID=UPI001430D77E|nr:MULTISPECIES: YhjD/YihY/BrkB family envelope integrity protein [unclassified Rhodococcus (in: high G+C Gram-positive bacteria)]MBY6410262.1 YihY/virulence factor BrkB family protein [Rhodococcus sp. BP-320]MBY6415231.1 YihY/virulence factor BrkB family protein [Rhodococcus sp. BP-321]MBY6424239.1 YihY/virulence factor BrkB family protein [Rhodococcus sp. BP-324]MBY6429379.1 YihY/virulence factor BrkB family protein [Rhodococcus sp. BP-323]MBY6430127.1 YihY/virulence factor BrkB family prote